MAASDGVSVIVRARDEARNLGRCLALIAAQRGVGEVEVIFVDPGSRDHSAALARAHGATVLEPRSGRFSYGAELNRGAASAGGELLIALSAHAFPRDEHWLRKIRQAFEAPDVACACGDAYAPDAEPLRRPILQDAALARRRPEWGYSNAAGAFRAELWRARPFRADLPACEDKEWALHWLAQGYTCLVDPELVVDHDHSRDSLRQIYRRAQREARGYAMFLEPQPPAGRARLAREWWSDLRWYDSAPKARLSPRRAARLLGAYGGRGAGVMARRGGDGSA